jgi:hypothetical protein
MDRNRFEELRRNVLDKFNNLEMMMNLSISMYYFKEINKDFIFRVLHDSLFSSALRINIFLKIVRDSDKKRYNKIANKIREMANIRNYFAHITPQYFDSNEEISMEKMGWYPHPKNPSEKIDLEEEHEKFFELEKEVHPYIEAVCGVLGVKFPVKF